MMLQRPDRSALEKVLADVSPARGKWRHTRLTLFAARVGAEFRGELMVVGRALNGGEGPWVVRDAVDGHSRLQIVEGALQLSTPTDCYDPMGWVSRCWGQKENYNTRRSQFWRTVRGTVHALVPKSEGIESTWPSRVIWSNLYKVSLAQRGNPSVTLRRAQERACIEALSLEIEHWKPRRVLLLTGADWSNPFVSALRWDLAPAPDPRVHLEGVTDDGAHVVVAPHPQGWTQGLLAAGRHLAVPVARPRRLGNGRTMTVVILGGDYRRPQPESGLLDIERTLTQLQLAQTVLDRAVLTV